MSIQEEEAGHQYWEPWVEGSEARKDLDHRELESTRHCDSVSFLVSEATSVLNLQAALKLRKGSDT